MEWLGTSAPPEDLLEYGPEQMEAASLEYAGDMPSPVPGAAEQGEYIVSELAGQDFPEDKPAGRMAWPYCMPSYGHTVGAALMSGRMVHDGAGGRMDLEDPWRDHTACWPGPSYY